MADNSLNKGRYTKYSNKIGLYSNSKGSFVKNDTSVVLSFPFKDAVLEAGMSKEDVGREERFLHIELDSKDIDTLEEPKVLTDFSNIDKEGEKPLTASSDVEFFDAEGKLKQNLLIKGNNLLALYTLRERLAGQVKLIYIDPPYNTGNDGFRYNDSFNHSAWLAFMKNRLEVARELLTDDGVIFVHCDDNEQSYLKVLLDEVFGGSNFQATIINNATPNGRDYGFFAQNQEYIHVYSKDPQVAKLNKIAETNTEKYKKEDKIGRYYLHPLFNSNSNFHKGNRPNLYYPFYVSNTQNQEGYYDLSLVKKDDTTEVYPPPSQKDGTEFVWRWGKEKAEKNLNLEIVGQKTSNGGFRVAQKMRLGDKIPRTIWSEASMSNRRGTEEMQTLFNGKIFAYPKAEELIKVIVAIGSNEGDVVLDFCLGSGTTSAVAHKMNRRWIGIEQMDYIEDVAKERLKKVVAGEQGGISKDVGWNGGGSFVYLELKKYNQEYVDRIMQSTSLSELEDLYVDMRNNAFLKFWFDRHAFEKDEDFRKLDLDKRKKALVDVLDENQLYLNYADMGDTRHNVTTDEKTLTDKFYATSEN
jgi:adenine-specific DNA-methyltransferase